jgi:hypothetical protein
VTATRPAAERVRAAVAAARAVATEHGLRVEEVRLVHDGVNVVLHLAPAPVAVRVATLTPLLRDGARSFAREVELAGALAKAGAAVIPPSDLVPPGPHTAGGLALSFWRYVEVLPERPTPELAGRTLADLHAVLADVAPPWEGAPLDTPLDDLALFAERGAGLAADPVLVERLAGLTQALRPRLEEAVDGAPHAVHGDAHPGNLIATRDGWRWADLEDTCRAPWAWDLAVLRSTRQLDGRAALAAMPHPPTDDELAPFVWLRRLHGAAWWFVHAVRVPEDLPTAHQRLLEAVEEVSAGLAGRRPGPGRP